MPQFLRANAKERNEGQGAKEWGSQEAEAQLDQGTATVERHLPKVRQLTSDKRGDDAKARLPLPNHCHTQEYAPLIVECQGAQTPVAVVALEVEQWQRRLRGERLRSATMRAKGRLS